MVAQVINFSGCCHGRIFYDLGSAHNKKTAKDQDQFNSWIKGKTNQINVAITNDEQETEKKFLKTQGWKSVMVGDLELHYARGYDLKKYFDSHKPKIKDCSKELEALIRNFNSHVVIKSAIRPTYRQLINLIKLILPENHRFKLTDPNNYEGIEPLLGKLEQIYISMYLNTKYDISLPANLAGIGYGEFGSLHNSVVRRMKANERAKLSKT